MRKLSRVRLATVIVAALVMAGVATDFASADSTVYVASASRPQHDGYWLVTANGKVSAYGAAASYGDMSSRTLNQPIVGLASTADGKGYWLVAGDGGIFSFGDASFYGSTGSMHLNKPVIGISATASGQGYWLVASDGGIFSFGDAKFFGSTGNINLAKPIVSMSAMADGNGYWMVASDGGIFAYGGAGFFGSTGAMHLVQPVVGMAPTLSGQGYWLVARDGGIFSFGDATFLGSTAANGKSNVIAISTTATGYDIVASDGSVSLMQPSTLATITTVPAPTSSTSTSTSTTSTTVHPTTTTSTVPPTTTTTVPSDGSGQALPVGDLPGWHQTLAQDFNAASTAANFDATYASSWCGYTDGTASKYYKIISAHDGLMDFNLDGTKGAAGSFGNPSTFCGSLYGRYSARIKVVGASGYGTAMMVWPNSNVWGNGEVDYPEGDFDSTLSVNQHGTNCTNCSAADSFNTGATWTSWHTVTTEWTPTGVKYYLDGALVKSTTTNVPFNNHRMTIQMAPTSTPAATGHFLVAWVAEWAMSS